MSISISIPMNWARSVAKGKYIFEADGGTLEECLNNLDNLLPKIKKFLYYGNKKILQSTITILLNDRPVDAGDPLIKVKDGDRIQIKNTIR